jgi:hypothetical protein
MIITEAGRLVGRLEDDTLELSDVRSERLQQLVDDWRENGFAEPAPAEVPDDYSGPKPTCAMTSIVIPFTTDNLGVIENKLLIAGFDVQPG